ncbi:MAG TPA: hypothetical protein VFM05_02340, partial [Candidatus Saccharimonadales bacterium]|nr:hypothetical protein [Candidatus Saccharimonadales bacterium]
YCLKSLWPAVNNHQARTQRRVMPEDRPNTKTPITLRDWSLYLSGTLRLFDVLISPIFDGCQILGCVQIIIMSFFLVSEPCVRTPPNKACT